MWSSTTNRYIRYNGVWLSAGAVDAIDLGLNYVRVFLRGGPIIHVPLLEGDDATTLANLLWKANE